ncbi:MAG: PAS domain-containing protein [Pseudohongiellaceae bacterium]
MSLLEDAIESCDSAILIVDSEGYLVEFTDTTDAMFGYTKEELIGSSIDKLIAVDLHQKHRAYVSNYFNNPTTRIMGSGRVVEGIRKDGSQFSADIRISSFTREEAVYGVANIIDLSASTTMNRLLTTTQAVARIGSWRVDLSSNQAIWSKMVYEIHEVDENVQISVDEGINFYVEEHRPIISACVENCIEKREPWDIELKILTSSGRENWVHAIGVPVINSENIVVGLEGTFRDIHEEKLTRIERETALKKLKRTEQLSKMGHWEWRIEPEKVEWSEGLYELWELDSNCPPPSIEEHGKYIHPEDQEQFFSTLEESIANGEPYSVDFRLETSKGTKYVHVEGSPQFDHEGNLVAFFGTAQDVSDTRKTQLLADSFNTRLTLALNAAKTGVWELDLISDELTWDEQMFTLYGIGEDSFSGAYDAWVNGLHPEDIPRTTQEIEDAKSGKAAFNTRFRVLWPNGNIRHIRALAQVVREPSGLPVSMVGVNWDITEEIERDELLKQSNEGYALMTQGASVGIWDWPNVHKNKENWSDKFYELLGYKRSELEASRENFGKLLHPEDSERTFAAMDEHFGGDAPFDLDYRLKTKTGEYRWFRGTGQVSRDENGKPARMVGSIQDIHDRVIAAANLSKLNEELIQFSYRTSHDLRAPLTTSKRLAEYIAQDIKNGDHDEAVANAEKIVKQMTRLESLVGDILELAKAELRSDDDTVIDFTKLEREVADRLSWMLEESQCELVFDIDTKMVVLGQHSRYSQIVENLISNGIKYRNQKTEHMYVKVRMFSDSDNVRIDIQDNGIGIPQRNQKDLFKMFKRFHPKVSNGSGLGLSIVKKHLDIMGGNIEVESSEKGTNFSITVPKTEGEVYE